MPDSIKGMYINIHHHPIRYPVICNIINVIPNTPVVFNPGFLVSGNFIPSVYDRLCGKSSVLELIFFVHVGFFWFFFCPNHHTFGFHHL